MLPHTLDELVALPGIGRKTANVILGNAFDIPGITVDTHFGRLVRRWGWTAEDDPVKVEHAVGALVPKRDWTIVSHEVIFHGRRVCHAAQARLRRLHPRGRLPLLRHRARRTRRRPQRWSRARAGRACCGWRAPRTTPRRPTRRSTTPGRSTRGRDPVEAAADVP